MQFASCVIPRQLSLQGKPDVKIAEYEPGDFEPGEPYNPWEGQKKLNYIRHGDISIEFTRPVLFPLRSVCV